MNQMSIEHAERRKNPANILYDSVLGEIEELIKKLEIESNHDRIDDAMKQVRDLVAPIHLDLKERIYALQRHVRWDKFTIAFYGETNAGKSTIIETLRIILQERTKVEDRKAFRAKEAEFGISEAAMAELAQDIEKSRTVINELHFQTAKLNAQFGTEQKVIEQEMNRMQHAIRDLKRTASLLRRLLWLFRKPKEKIEYAHLQQQLRDRDNGFSAERARLNTQIDSAQATLQSLEARQAKAHALIDSLLPLTDGQIIGTGRSDYTLETHGYEFETDVQRFELLDVPGIEGKEDRVIHSILEALNSAHAVFYVTGKPTPPQTGEDRQGVLEKIRAHLGDQTEVWTIFNKRITNPIQLEKRDLVSPGESASLAVLDEKMREHLGENYQGHIALSAQPAFLAVADCLVAGTDVANSRKKFLSKLTQTDVLMRSGFQAFIDWLRSSIVTDSVARIRAANVHKVRCAVQKSAGKITQIQNEFVAPLAATVREDWDRVYEQLDFAVKTLGSALQSHANAAISTFEADVRFDIYEQIDNDINNDDMKRALSRAIKTGQETLESNLQEKMKNELERFQDNVKVTLEGFQRRVDDLQNTYLPMGTSGLPAFDLHVKVDDGIKYKSLVASLGGGLLMLWNPSGWVVLALGGVTLILSLAKAFAGWLDKDYKKSQQRKAADENIGRALESMRKAMKPSHEQIMDIVKTRIDEIKTEFEISVKQIANINSALIHISAELARVSADTTKLPEMITATEVA
jgi:energy-coupling factor transporter ATP-binding protein EcfA2